MPVSRFDYPVILKTANIGDSGRYLANGNGYFCADVISVLASRNLPIDRFKIPTPQQ